MEGQLEISSQFENRELFKSEYQIGVIDRFALPEQLRVSYSELYAKLTAIKKEIEYLKRQDEPSKRDYLEFQIKEIGDLGLQAGEEDTLKQKIETADNMQKIQSLVSQLEDLISSSNGALSQADRRMNDLTKIMAVGDLADRLRSLSIECADIERSFNRLTSNIDENMIDDEARERYNKLCSIFMKHGVKGSHELLAKYAEMSAELKSLFAVPDKIRDLNKEYYKTLKTAEEEAQKMQKLRLNIIPGIESKIAEYLAKFGMERAVFKIVIIKSEELGEHGFDSIKFMVNTIGSGEMFQVKNLSGGELSRLLLALKLIDNEQGRFILFDEIDSNIGGEVASRAAQELKESSKSNQIVVVTHFPQTAARGDAHFVVEKSGEDDIQSMLHQVDKAERIKELARMMGDSSSTANFEAARKLVRS